MKCKKCGCQYGISDYGPWVDDGSHRDLVCIHSSWTGIYNYADGLCVNCFDDVRRRQEELDALLNPDNEPPF